jgi:GT2 family glycosyltransferase
MNSTRHSVSVIICTRNRAKSLGDTLRSFGQLEVPTDISVELLVVDNGSTDETARVVTESNLSNLHVRYIWEPRRGQCFARNRGLAESTGDIILFTDDDVRTPRHWIDGMCRPIAEGAADAVAGGIRMAPHLERPWLKGYIRAVVACTDSGTSHGRCPTALIGANMAFSRRVLDRVPCFDTELGPGALGFGDESLFAAQLLRAGFSILSARQVCVEHHFDQHRLDRCAFMETSRRMGQAQAYIAHHWEHRTVLLPSSRQAYLGAKLFLRRLLRRLSGGDVDVVAPWEISYVTRIGFYAQYARSRRSPRKYDQWGLEKRRLSG